MKATPRYVLSLLFALVPALFFALDVPAMNGPVNDLADVLSPAERTELTEYLLGVDRQTAAQIAVLTVPSLEGDDIESFSIRTAESWRLGGQGTDLGALIVVAPAERVMRIEAGYGAEATLTDAKCGIIIRNIMAPAFRNGKYGEGILGASKMIAEIITGNEIAQEQITHMETAESKNQGVSSLSVGFVFFIIYLLLTLSIAGRRRRRYGGAFLFPMMTGGFGSRGFSGGSRGFSGGGFRGGGGHFGGGGASGKW